MVGRGRAHRGLRLADRLTERRHVLGAKGKRDGWYGRGDRDGESGGFDGRNVHDPLPGLGRCTLGSEYGRTIARSWPNRDFFV
jgi:hypothetical protein